MYQKVLQSISFLDFNNLNENQIKNLVKVKIYVYHRLFNYPAVKLAIHETPTVLSESERIILYIGTIRYIPNIKHEEFNEMMKLCNKKLKQTKTVFWTTAYLILECLYFYKTNPSDPYNKKLQNIFKYHLSFEDEKSNLEILNSVFSYLYIYNNQKRAVIKDEIIATSKTQVYFFYILGAYTLNSFSNLFNDKDPTLDLIKLMGVFKMKHIDRKYLFEANELINKITLKFPNSSEAHYHKYFISDHIKNDNDNVLHLDKCIELSNRWEYKYSKLSHFKNSFSNHEFTLLQRKYATECTNYNNWSKYKLYGIPTYYKLFSNLDYTLLENNEFELGTKSYKTLIIVKRREL